MAASLKKDDKIFIAGGNGMVGSAVIKKLISSGYTNLVTNYHSRLPSSIGLGETRYVKLDLRRQVDTEAFFAEEQPERVVLAAAKVGGIMANNTYKAEFIYDNITIGCNVINAAHKYGTAKLVNLGSSCIYPRLAPQPMKEEYLLTGPLEPTNEAYAVAKIAAIKLCRYFNEQYGTNFVSLMPPNLYGPNDNFNFETAHVPPALLRKFHLAKLLANKSFDMIGADVARFPLGFGLDEKLNQDRNSLEAVLGGLGIGAERVTIWGSGSPFREFLYVDDCADAVLFFLEKYDYGDIGEFVNVGMGEDLTILQLATLIKEVVGFSGEIRQDTTKQDGMPKKLLDVSLAHRLGWQAHTSLKEGLKKMYAWYLETGHQTV